MREDYKLVYSKANVVMIIERYVGQRSFLDATIHIFDNSIGLTKSLIKIHGLPVSDDDGNVRREILKYLAFKNIEIKPNCDVVCYEFVLSSGSYRYGWIHGEGKPLAEFYPSDEKPYRGGKKGWRNWIETKFRG